MRYTDNIEGSLGKPQGGTGWILMRVGLVVTVSSQRRNDRYRPTPDLPGVTVKVLNAAEPDIQER